MDGTAAPQIEATPLSAEHYDALASAVATLENPNFAARIANYAGAPINRAIALLPPAAGNGISKVVERAMLQCLRTAIRSLEVSSGSRPARLLSTMAAGVTGGVSGFVGAAALAVELPVTTTLMLRAVADIARHNGEDLSKLETRLACLQVFALGSTPSGVRTDVGYLAARAALTRLTGSTAALMVERGAAELSSAAMNRFLAALVSRFSVVLTDRIAASSVPVIGAVGGATVNVIFMNHFQQIAQGHFTVRRLERHYGADVVRRHYERIASQTRPERR